MMTETLSSGERLAKVMYYYGVLDNVSSRVSKIVCPFHGDVNPSLNIDFSKGHWYCFGCGRGGEALDFVVEAERYFDPNLNSLQTLMIYNDILSGTPTRNRFTFKVKSRAERKVESRELYDISYDYYHGLSKVDWNSTEIPEAVRVREYMRNRGFSPDTLSTVGAKITYRDPYQLVFPIMDNGKFKGWVCRTDDPEVAKYRKYLYNKGFRRANTVVGSYDNSSPLFIVEGYMDRLKLLQLGLTNVVAIFGWKISDRQIAKIKSAGIRHVISALDNDECGRKGTDYLRKHFDVTRFRYLRKYKDPGDFTQQDCDRMVSKTMQGYRLR